MIPTPKADRETAVKYLIYNSYYFHTKRHEGNMYRETLTIRFDEKSVSSSALFCTAFPKKHSFINL